MPALMPLLFYDDPSTQGQPERRLRDSGDGVSDGASFVSAFDQPQIVQETPVPRTSIAGKSEFSSVGHNGHYTNKMKPKKVPRKKSHRERQLGDAEKFTGTQSDYKLKDLTNSVKDEAMGQDKYTVKAESFVHAVRAVKKAAYSVQMALYEGVQNKSQLQAASALLTEGEYADVITERGISQLCGFPLCKQPLHPNSARRGRYKISLREHKVYDIQERNSFCSSDCLIASKTFSATLQSDRDGTVEQEKLNKIIATVHGLILSPNEPVDTVLEGAEVSLKVHESDHSSFEEFKAVGPSDAIEGYVPQMFQDREHLKCKFESGSSSMENQENITRSTKVSDSTSVCHSKFSPKGSISSCKEQDNPYSSLDIDKPTIMELKSALSGTQKKHGVRVSWADESDMKPAFQGNELGVDEVTISEPEDQTLLSSQMLATSRVELTPCLEDESSLNMSFEAGNLNVVHQAAEPDPDLDTSNKKRLASAEVLACALSEAAAATEAGELEASEAALKFGLSFLSAFENEMKPSSFGMDGSAEISELTHRPKPEWFGKEDDLPSADSMSTWYDAPPKGYKLELSMFGTIWMALEEWISTDAVVHIYGREHEGQDSFVPINGREYKQQIFLEDGVSTEISRTFSSCISRVLPDVVQALRLSIPVSVLEQALGRFLRSMSFVEALPSLNTKQWRVIVALFLDALSVHRLPTLGVQFGNNRALLRKVVSSSGLSDAEYETFKDLLLPLGRLPSFATSCGG